MEDFFWYSDAQWARIEPLLPTDTRGKERAGCPGRSSQSRPSNSWISVSSAFPSVNAMSQKSSVTQSPQSVP